MAACVCTIVVITFNFIIATSIIMIAVTIIDVIASHISIAMFLSPIRRLVEITWNGNAFVMMMMVMLMLMMAMMMMVVVVAVVVVVMDVIVLTPLIVMAVVMMVKTMAATLLSVFALTGTAFVPAIGFSSLFRF
jgi:hypothetical protein